MTNLLFRMMGPLETCTKDGWVTLSAPKWQTILALLLINRNQIVSMEQIIDELWGDFPPAGPTKTVQVYVSRVRQSMTDGLRDRLVSRASGYQLIVDPPELDTHVFNERLIRARGALTEQRPDAAVSELREALALSRGPALVGVPGTTRIPAEVLRLEEMHRTALLAYLDARLLMGESQSLIAELRGLTAAFPFDEGLWARLMLALARAGRQGDALEAFNQARGMLVSQLGVEPGDELRQAQGEVLSGVDQGTGTFAHLMTGPDHGASPSAAAVTPRQLPPSIAGFAGRQADLRQLDRLVSDGRERPSVALAMADITGEPGVGKTSMAMHWAQQTQASFPDGQLFADLTGAAGQAAAAPTEILSQFIRAVCPMPHDMPDSLEERSALYRSLLAGKRVLVLLDNARDAAQVKPLLPGSAECLVLVTSRNELTELVRGYGALHLPLGKLAADEANQLRPYNGLSSRPGKLAIGQHAIPGKLRPVPVQRAG